MVPAAIIAKKRDSGELSTDEIQAMVGGFLNGEVADYQMAAWAMAVVCRGMTSREVSALTTALLDSGTRLPRVSDRPRVDKHSTGGLGDSPSLILAPLLACFDLDVPMLSGRGLGITGGTLDKLEAIPGFRCDLTVDEIAGQLQAIGCVITGTTPDIAPADKRLYALRDVTGTVESIPLITASIMSKKLAESLDALVLDVKFGSAAFMQTLSDARTLAESLLASGRNAAVKTVAVLSDMHQPLGRMIGNACEVNEAIEVLEGNHSSALATVTLRLAAELIVATGKASDFATAEKSLAAELISGRPLERFRRMVEWQGGRMANRLKVATANTLEARRSGYVSAMNGRRLGQAIIEMGGGRKALGDIIDPAVGIEMLVRIGDRIERGQPMLKLFTAVGDRLDTALQLIREAITIDDSPPPQTPLILSL